MLREREGTLHHVKVKAGHILRVLRDVLGVAHARGASHALLTKYVDHPQAEGARDTTIKKELRVFGGAWKLARRNQIVAQPLDEIMPELADDCEPRKRALTPWEVIGLALVLPPNRMAVVAFAVSTGCDPGALWRARPEDVADDFSSCRIHGTKRKSRERTAPVPLPEQRTLLAWALEQAEGADEKPLFAAWANMRRDLGAACEKLEIAACSPNDLRRTYATWLRSEGVEPQLIGAAMGHTDSRMVERVYGKLPHDALARLIANRVNRLHVELPAKLDELPRARQPTADGSPADRTVRLMSGESAQTGLSEGIADKTASVATARDALPIVVRRGGIEPPTRGFSVPCSTN
jgi:integrase